MNSPFGDTTYTKVFVGGLAWETQSHTLRRHFEQYGDILEAVVISDKNTGRSKGYGFVTFRDSDSARRACVDPNPIIDGRRANCNLASLGRPHPFPPLPPNHGIQRSGVVPSFGNMNSSTHRPAYNRSPNPYNQQPFPYAFHQPGFYYTPYGYGTYGSEYLYPQGVYNPYPGGQQYIQVSGMAGNVSPGVSPRGQFAQPIPGYSTLPNYGMPSPAPAHQILQFANRSPTAALPSIQPPPPHSDGGQAQITSLSSNSPHFTSGSDQTPT